MILILDNSQAMVMTLNKTDKPSSCHDHTITSDKTQNPPQLHQHVWQAFILAWWYLGKQTRYHDHDEASWQDKLSRSQNHGDGICGKMDNSHTAIIMMIPEKTDNPSHLHDHDDATCHERQAITLSQSYLTIQTGLHMILSWCFLTSHHIHSLSWSHLTIQTCLHVTVITMMLSDKPSHCHDHIWQYKHAFTLSYYDASWRATTLSWSYLTIQTGLHIIMMLPDKPSHCHDHIWQYKQAFTLSYYHDASWQAITLSWSYLTIQTGLHITMINTLLPDKPPRCHNLTRDRHFHLHDYHDASWQTITLPCSYLTRETGLSTTMIIMTLPDKPSHCPWSYLTREAGIYISMIIMFPDKKDKQSHYHDHK